MARALEMFFLGGGGIVELGYNELLECSRHVVGVAHHVYAHSS